MIERRLIYLLLAIIILASLCPTFFTSAKEGAGGERIDIQASGIYEDDAGREHRTSSQIVTITINSVSHLYVTPNETESSAEVSRQHEYARAFQICNGGNYAERVLVSSVEVTSPARISSLYFDNDTSGTVTESDQLISVGETYSPIIQPGSCTGVRVQFRTEDYPARTLLTLRLKARTTTSDTANGIQEAQGQIINRVIEGPRLTSPDNEGNTPQLLANGVPQTVAASGQTITYTLKVRNSGDATAEQVTYANDLPDGLELVAGTLKTEGLALKSSSGEESERGGRRVELSLKDIKPGEEARLEFKARVKEGVIQGRGLRTFGTLSGRNFAPVRTTDAVAIVDPFGVLFSASSGTPVQGAEVTLLRDTATETPMPLAQGVGFPPNTENSNPYATDGQGRFSLALLPEQMGHRDLPAVYYLRVTAQGYLRRTLKLSVRPTHSGLFQAEISSIDGQKIAEAGSYQLARTEIVAVTDLSSLAFNVPLFDARSLEIDKAVERERAEIGDAVTYTINVRNPTKARITSLIIKDLLPISFQYAEGTLRIERSGSRVEVAEQQGGDVSRDAGDNHLRFTIGVLEPAGRVQIRYRARIGVNARRGWQYNEAVAEGVYPNGERVRTAAARASVFIGEGVFTTQQFILGRVYEDANDNGQFDKEDSAIVGARVYLMNGQYSVTDSAGLYNFPSLGDGAIVIALDPSSVDPGLKVRAERFIASRSWARLLRTPIGGGSLLHQDFALVREEASSSSVRRAAESDKGPVALTPAAKSAASPKERAAGTYKIASTEKIAPVKPGSLIILEPSANSALVTSGAQVKVRVALSWTAALEINGKQVSDKNIGESRLDRANQVATFTYAGLTLPPGLNTLRATPIGPKGERGDAVEMRVMGRGPARRLEIQSAEGDLVAGGKQQLTVTVRALDQWGNPALDGLLSLEAEGAQFVISDARAQVAGRVATERKDLSSQTTVNLKDGEARVQIVSPGVRESARIKAAILDLAAETEIRVVAEKRPALLVGLAEASFGNVPEVGLRNEAGQFRGRISLFFRGTLWDKNILTLAYDSQRPLNRDGSGDRLFQFDAGERAYPIFGDSSTLFDEAQSNSKLYMRVERRRSYLLFGDMEADMKELQLTGYSRKLTGIKLRVEDRAGSYVTLTGARPTTTFSRDVFPGGALSLVELTYGEILPGSETVSLEVRDRRNPETILSSEVLQRGVDYNLDPVSGQIFFLRFIPVFDYQLNLYQIVVTYEHSAAGLSSTVLTGRALKKFPGSGLQLGVSIVNMRKAGAGNFWLSGIDAEKKLPRGGILKAELAMSRGQLADFESSDPGDGFAYSLDYSQPIPIREAVISARLRSAGATFRNPFGATITPGARKGEIALSFKPRRTSTARVSFTSEHNKTDTVDNSRTTLSALWTEAIGERLRMTFGYDFRHFTDNASGREIRSNLLTAAFEFNPTDRLQLTAKREQNLGESDPSYPTQTTLGASYRLNNWARLFYTHRMAEAPIIPIADARGTGFSQTPTRSEMAFGVESRLTRYTSMTGRYQIENGIEARDSFAIVGLTNRFPIRSGLSLELGYERGFHLKGRGKSFNSVTVGAAWQPREDFIANFRYELRDRNNADSLFVAGAAGRITEGVTALARFQFTRASTLRERTATTEGQVAVAFRPESSDRYGLLFSYNRRARLLDGAEYRVPTREQFDSFAADGFYQLTDSIELTGKGAARFTATGQAGVPFVSTLTYLAQGRAQYRFTGRMDLAAEMRALFQPDSGTARRAFGVEAGYWLLPELRFGVGYNFTRSTEPSVPTFGAVQERKGFYFTVSSKLSNLYDLFGKTRRGEAEDEASAKR